MDGQDEQDDFKFEILLILFILSIPANSSCRKIELEVDSQSVDAFGGLHDGLGDGRVRVDDAPQLFGRRFEVEGDDGLVDDLGRVRADDVDAEQLVVLRLADDLDE